MQAEGALGKRSGGGGGGEGVGERGNGEWKLAGREIEHRIIFFYYSSFFLIYCF